MNRRHLFKSVMALVAGHSLPGRLMAAGQPEASKMPVLFIGHGSPMNALADNPFSQHLNKLGNDLPRPRAIVVISAHWVAQQPTLNGGVHPKTIYDFGGFPKALYEMEYPSPGAPALAKQIAGSFKTDSGKVDDARGLDHGAWTILHHLYPQADIPVIQLAMSTALNMKEHVLLASELQELRKEGVLIIGSGNIVHNLRATDKTPGAKTKDWALEFDGLIKDSLLQRDLKQLLAQDKIKYPLWQQSHPTLEHYVPLLYALGASTEEDAISFPFEGFESASLSMRSVLFG